MALLIRYYSESSCDSSSEGENQENDKKDKDLEILRQEQQKQQIEELSQALSQALSDLLERTGQIMAQSLGGQGGQSFGQGDDGVIQGSGVKGSSSVQGNTNDRARVESLLGLASGLKTLDDVKHFLHTFVSSVVDQGPFSGWDAVRDILKKNELAGGLLVLIISEHYKKELDRLKKQEDKEKEGAVTDIICKNKDDLADLLKKLAQNVEGNSKNLVDPENGQTDRKDQLKEKINGLLNDPDTLSHVQKDVCSVFEQQYKLSSDKKIRLQNGVESLLLDVINGKRSPGGAVGACTSYAAVLAIMS